MADILATGASWLANQMKASAAQSVVYVRGALSVAVSATIGKTEFDVQDSEGFLQRHIARDYLILAADLVLDGVTILPERGDQVRETVGTDVLIYEVNTPSPSEQHYRYSDQYRQRMRIHTKQIGREPV